MALLFRLCALFALITVNYSTPHQSNHYSTDQIPVPDDDDDPMASNSKANIVPDTDEWIHFDSEESQQENGTGTNLLEGQQGNWHIVGCTDIFHYFWGRNKETMDDVTNKMLEGKQSMDKLWEMFERDGTSGLVEEDILTNAVDEVCMDWQQRVDEKRRPEMERLFRQRSMKRQQLDQEDSVRVGLKALLSWTKDDETENGDEHPYKSFGDELAPFVPEKFRQDVNDGKPCDDEPLQAAVYYLFKNSDKVGIYHAGLRVCGIEIHFHRPGVEFWKPMEYSTRFPGGTYCDYRPITYKGKPLYTNKSFRQIVPIVEKMKPFFRAVDYNLLNRNCLLFARTLVHLITGINRHEVIDWPSQLLHPVKKPYIMAMRSFGGRLESILKSGQLHQGESSNLLMDSDHNDQTPSEPANNSRNENQGLRNNNMVDGQIGRK